MPSSPTSPTPELRRARRACEGLTGVEMLGDLIGTDRRWAQEVRIDCRRDDGAVPRLTRWFVVIDRAYPDGAIDVYPARAGGVVDTFPHQDRNEAGDADFWRAGKLCLDEPSAILGRAVTNHEPREVDFRLRWHVERAVAWVEAAASNGLLAEGADFELPALPQTVAGRDVVLVCESATTLPTWLEAPNHGTVKWTKRRHLLVAGEFRAADFKLPMEWGSWASGMDFKQESPWIILPDLPVLPPWRSPGTWGELRRAARSQDVDLDADLRRCVERLRYAKPPLLFLGSPIPERVGGDLVEVHWQVVRVEGLPRRKNRGARIGKLDKQALSDDTPLAYMRVENASRARLTARGGLVSEVRRLHFLLIGAGALGSPVAELLVREGTHEVTVVDGERFAPGNCARHTLGLDAVGLIKAGEVASRLASASPGVRVRGISTMLPSDPAELLDAADVIVDMTGSDDVLVRMACVDLAKPKNWFSVWMSYGLRHLMVFSSTGHRFPLDEFRAISDPLLNKTRVESEEGVREGPGCWHPRFPGRASAVAVFAGLTVQLLEARLASNNEDGSSIVALERELGADGIPTIRQVFTSDG